MLGSFFSDSGDTLFPVGRAGPYPTLSPKAVLSVDASNGTLLDSTDVPAVADPAAWTAGLAPDPTADFLYLAGFTASDSLVTSPGGDQRHRYRPTLAVYRRSTLDLLAVMRVPDGARPVDWWFFSSEKVAVIPAPAEGVGYLLVTPSGTTFLPGRLRCTGSRESDEGGGERRPMDQGVAVTLPGLTRRRPTPGRIP